jgi:hypothetical protein
MFADTMILPAIPDIIKDFKITANIDRLNEYRFSRYFCNKCDREYTGCPKIVYENPNEELGEGIVLIEKGEYRCKICNNIIAIYRRFNRDF